MIFGHRKQIDSPHNFGLVTNDKIDERIKFYFESQLNLLCADLNLPITKFEQIPFENIFTDVEFNNQVPDQNDESFINKHFYPKLFRDIKKKSVKNENSGRDFYSIDYRLSYCFTLDRSLTTSTTISGVSYGFLCLGITPVLYYIGIDLQKIIDISKR